MNLISSDLSRREIRDGRSFFSQLKVRKIEELLIEGCDVNEISRHVGLSPRTIKLYANRAYQKYGIRGKAKKVQFALKFHSVPPTKNNVFFTKKEKMLLYYLTKALTNRQIAEERILSTEQVIKNRLRTLYNKTGMSNRTELAVWAASRGFDRGVHVE